MTCRGWTPSTTSPTASPRCPAGRGSAPSEGSDDDADADEMVRSGHEAVEAYCVNLNKKAAEGRIDPLIGRQKEIERTIQILCRRNKNNPLYVGEAGVGKTAIAEGLARRIVHGRGSRRARRFHHLRPRHGDSARRHPLPGRLRGTPEKRHLRAGRRAGRHPVHRRDPHGDRRRRHQRRLHGRLQHPEALAGQRLAALHGLHHLQGIPELLREGPGPGAPVPENRHLRALGGGNDQDPARAQAIFRETPQGPLHRRVPAHRRRAVRSVTSTTASCPTRPST